MELMCCAGCLPEGFSTFATHCLKRASFPVNILKKRCLWFCLNTCYCMYTVFSVHLITLYLASFAL